MRLRLRYLAVTLLVLAAVALILGKRLFYSAISSHAAVTDGSVVEAELARRIARRNVDAVLTTEKAAIQEETRAAAQKLVNDCARACCLHRLTSKSSTPPPEAAEAFPDDCG